jgi:hypothetical protein
MTPQTPAQGILLHKDYGDAKYYTVPCECYSTDCAHTVCVEAEDTGIVVTTYTTQKTKWWEFNRFRIIWRLLTKGYVEYEATIIMNEQQALNYANVLTQSVNDVKIFKQQRKSKQNV